MSMTLNSTMERRPPIASPAQRLQEIARRCQHGEPLDRHLSRWLGTALDAYLERTSESLEEALGLRYGRGGVPWWREAAIRQRDAALRKMASEFFADLPLCARSQRIAELATRYAATAWRTDRDAEGMPPSYAMTVREPLWAAFRSGATMPLGERQIRNIIAE